MLAFVDFETKGLNGGVFEAFSVDENGNEIASMNVSENDCANFESFMEKVLSKSDIIVFWHSFFPIYLSKFYYEIFYKMKGQFASFLDFYSIFDGLKQPRYKIDNVTYILTGRNHKGNAKDDCYDLYECFNKTK